MFFVRWEGWGGGGNNLKLNLELSYHPKFFSLYVLEIRTFYFIIFISATPLPHSANGAVISLSVAVISYYKKLLVQKVIGKTSI